MIRKIELTDRLEALEAPLETPQATALSQSNNYHHGNLSASLIKQGLELLEIRGSAEISVRELAREIGVSTGAAYRHFANKDALMVALAVEGCKILLKAQMDAILTEKHPEAKFRNIGRAYLNFAIANPALFQLMFGRFTAGSHNAELNHAADLIYKNLLEVVSSALKLPSTDLRVITFASQAWSLVHGLSVLVLNGQFQRVTPDIDGLINAIFKNQMTLGQ
jgi:AcrR family transcriptional regulator